MADTPPPVSSEASTPPSSAAEQARIRKERREAKIRAGGSARLNKISGLGGGVQRDAPPKPTVSHGDPDEVDISQHFYEPQRTTRAMGSSPSPIPGGQPMNDDALRQMMLGFDPAAGSPGMGGMSPGGMPANPFAAMMGDLGMGEGAADDPMMKMMQQMMGSMGGGPNGPQGMPSFPGMQGMPPPAVAGSEYAYLWRIVHAVFALALGIYIAFTTTFTGTKVQREMSALDTSLVKAGPMYFFWIFATAELLLQSSRFFMEKGRVQQGGIMGTITGFLPEPYKGYLTWFSRYSRIWTTVSADAMACVFVLGACTWWRGN